MGYLSPRASEPLEGAGLFNGSYAAIAQASIEPTDSLGFGLTNGQASPVVLRRGP